MHTVTGTKVKNFQGLPEISIHSGKESSLVKNLITFSDFAFNWTRAFCTAWLRLLVVTDFI